MSGNTNSSSSYSSPATTLRRYWRGYGGCKALFTSPYFHLAILLALPGTFLSPAGWVDKAEAIVPSLLGLSLAGYAILLALGSGDFFERIRKRKANDRPSTLEGISTAFLHFVIVQSFTLVASLIYVSFAEFSGPIREWLYSQGCISAYVALKSAVGFVGWLGLFYSITCMIALSFRLYRMIQLVCHIPPSETPGATNS